MLTNLKEIEKLIYQKIHKEDRPVNNPIAAAFAHKLAVFVRT
jgi:hypothetical protein